MGSASTWPLLTRERHRRTLDKAQSALRDAIAARADIVVVAEELRTATQLLAELTGRAVLVDDVLDVIMRDFCIGKWFVVIELTGSTHILIKRYEFDFESQCNASDRRCCRATHLLANDISSNDANEPANAIVFTIRRVEANEFDDADADDDDDTRFECFCCFL